MTLELCSVGARAPAIRWRTAARSHRGFVRTLNEDSYLERPECGLWAVADGMGGHAAGEVASRKAVEALAKIDRRTHGEAMFDDIRTCMAQVNSELHSNALSVVMGTTIVMLHIDEMDFGCVWAGDSRAYCLSKNQLFRLTKDHSLVQEMVDAGSLDDRGARLHPRSNVLTRALGAARELDLSAVYGKAKSRDRYLLCSDGLTTMLEDHEIADLMCLSDVSECADRLMQETLKRGARDNVTLLLVECS